MHKIKQKLEGKIRCHIIFKVGTLIFAVRSNKKAWFVFINIYISINSDNLTHRQTEKEKTL